MCLILLAWRAHPDYPLVVAANRDEFFTRPAAEAGWWPDRPDVFAGRDLEAGGSWLGLSRSGRFAGLTNFRDPARQRPDAPSRGALVADFLAGAESTDAALARLTLEGPLYNGFNLLLSDGDSLGIYESESGSARRLEPGLYALSNHLLDTPWPKVLAGKSRLARALRALPDDTPLVLSGGMLQVDASERLGTLSGTGAVALAAGSQLTLGGAASSSFAGSFGGNLSRERRRFA